MCFVCSFPCVYGQFHACLLRSRPFLCSPPFSLCRFVLVGLWGYFVCLVASVPFGGLFGCNHVWEYISVMFGLLATCLSILCLALHVKVSHVSPFVCLTTCIPFPFVWYPVAKPEFKLRGGKTCIRYMQFMHIMWIYNIGNTKTYVEGMLVDLWLLIKLFR